MILIQVIPPGQKILSKDNLTEVGIFSIKKNYCQKNKSLQKQESTFLNSPSDISAFPFLKLIKHI